MTIEREPSSNALELWQQGYLLQTAQTLRWSKEEQKAADNEERRMVFKNFSALDEGRSRQLIAQCQTREQAEALVEEHNQAVTAALTTQQAQSVQKLVEASLFVQGWLEGDGKQKNIEAWGVLNHALAPFTQNKGNN